MRLKDFDFRIWDNHNKKYIDNISYSIKKYQNENKVFLPFSIDLSEYGNNETFKDEIQIPSNRVEIKLWTGFYDKNGKKIYEGDILYYFKDCSEGEVFKYQVLFKEGAFYLFESYDGFVDDEDLIAEFDLKELQVMGNIHENKELLNVRL
ncbi:YopX family protein [Campylobacter coli]|uniref:YopX family protein n=1 Tax=Campylobacter coli TaxID=195 RepID=UPI0030060963